MEIFRKQKENFRDFARGLQERSVLVVCDANTEPFTEDIGRTLSEAGKEISLFRFPDRHLVPEIGRLKELFAAAEGADYLLGVGSGVINDICKYLSAKTEKPCGILATAPSMDGYVSGVSALYENGRKVTLPAAPPREALIDVNILANAPLDMIVAGAGDLIGKHTSLLDWKLARDLKGEKYDAEIVARMEKALSLGMESAKKLVLRDFAAVETLIDGLLLSGIEMQRAGNSRPASGSEHHISHYLEMKGEEMGKDFAPHGVKVALGCLVSAAMYKYAAGEYAELSSLQGEIAALPAPETLSALYREIGLPAKFGEIGVSRELLEETVCNAWTVRERYTIMTFLHEKGALGRLAPALAERFA